MTLSKTKMRRLIDQSVRLATQRRTTTYSEMASFLGLNNTSGSSMAKELGPYLVTLNQWCTYRGIPPLAALVVRKSGQDKGIPGLGFYQYLYEHKLIEMFTLDDMKDTPAIRREVARRYIDECWDYFDPTKLSLI